LYSGCLLGTLLLAAATARADSAGIDVVLVMDASGSMKHTDPAALRLPAAKLFLSLLGDEDAAAVVSFSAQSETLIGLTPLRDAAARADVLNAAEQVTSDGMFTNLHAALAHAHALLADHAPADRARLVLLLSDGKIDSGDPARDRELVDAIAREVIPALRRDQITVHTIAFTDASDVVLLRDIARGTGGLAQLARTDADLHAAFAALFERAKTPDMLAIAGAEFIVDPSIREITIVAAKQNDGVSIELRAPDGTHLAARRRPSGVRWYVTPRFDMITLAAPRPGRWTILSNGGWNRAYVVTDLKLASNIDHHDKTLGMPLRIRAWLTQGKDKVTQAEMLDHTEIRAELEQPDGRIVTAVLQHRRDTRRAADDAGVYVVELAPAQTGLHQLRLVAESSTFTRSTAYLFQVVAPETTPAATAAHEPIAPPLPVPVIAAAAPQQDTNDTATAPLQANEDDVGVGTFIALFVVVNVVALAALAAVVLIRRQLRGSKAPRGNTETAA
jgi:Mg-chelatase subunit ChlD